MPTPNFISSINSAYNSTVIKTLGVTSQSGDMIVVSASTDYAADDPTFSALTGNGISFTIRATFDDGGFGASTAYIWTGIDNVGGTSWTLSLTGSSIWGMCCHVFRNTNSVGGTNTRSASGAPSLTLTTTTANSAIVMVIGDWAASGGPGTTRTWRTVNSITPTNGNGMESTYASQSQLVVYGAYWSDAGAAGSKNVGMTVPSSQSYASAAIEIIGAVTPPANSATIGWVVA